MKQVYEKLSQKKQESSGNLQTQFASADVSSFSSNLEEKLQQIIELRLKVSSLEDQLGKARLSSAGQSSNFNPTDYVRKTEYESLQKDYDLKAKQLAQAENDKVVLTAQIGLKESMLRVEKQQKEFYEGKCKEQEALFKKAKTENE